MRFAWLRERSAGENPVKQGCTHPLSIIRKAYNAAFWVFLIPFLTAIDYSTGFVAFTVIIVVRLALNLYTNNWLELEPHQFENYPFRV